MNKTQESKIIESTTASIGVIEALSNICLELEHIKDSTINAMQKESIGNCVSQLNNIINVLDEEANPITLNSYISLGFKSVIERLGIAGEVIKLRKQGITVNKIAEMFDITQTTIMRFFKYYDYLKPVEKLKYHESSVMNTTERLEELMNMILRRLHALEGIDDELHVKYIGELRQTFSLAAQVAEKIVTYQRYQQFTEDVWDILKTELPDRRAEIMAKIKQQQAHNSFLPTPK